MMDQMKMVAKLKKAQKELSKEVVEVEAGDGAVVVQLNGELEKVCKPHKNSRQRR